ncbi:hypothetical protein SAMN05720606_13124 [Paenibacillus polysaccharolyticus]|uniref:Uncharacterized protein n=1 Tax=Paenibacillus polysaccharolyticus TaxID=582692 RepID=A0A1G5LMM2_9BACL|nr:hypothetical protein [Paenibacillus polysaccharolyticus]SCZ14066.1 hypothetical protein SAMN05720606_13124 [Paenibacillus polysaccharolyticus]
MSNPKWLALHSVSFPVRIFSALLTCISMSLITVLNKYVPVSERMDNTYYTPFWSSLVITVLIYLAIVIFLMLPLSLFADAVSISVAQRTRGRIHPVVSVVIGYVLLAGLSGVLFSLFVFRGNTFLYMDAIRQICIMTLIFLIWQYILRAGSYWLQHNKQAKTG